MIHFYQPVALRVRKAVRGLSWAASAGKTPQPSIPAPREGLFSGEKGGLGGLPHLGGQSWLFLQRHPPPRGRAPLAREPSS